MANPGSDKIRKYLTTYSKDYKGPGAYSGMYDNLLNPERPIFYRRWIPVMMRDPHLAFGMDLLKGPILSKAKFTVESSDMEVADFVQRQIDKFWLRGASKALDSLVWGYSAHEVLYEFNKETRQIEFKDLEYFHPKDVKPVVHQGKLIAVELNNARDPLQIGDTSSNMTGRVYLKPPKVFWAVHDKKCDKWFGRSRLQGAFDTWWEIWMPKGYRTIRHLWFYRHAYDGGVLYYPDGTTQDPETGEDISNALIAQEMLDRKETGSSLALPNKTGENRDWEYEPAAGAKAPDGLFDYGDVLRDELWEGIGVPPEVAKGDEGGSFAGRRIPQQAFYCGIQEIANDLCWDLDFQIIRKLVKLFKGENVPYEIKPVSIMETLQQEEMGQSGGEDPMGEDPNAEPELDEDGNPIEETDEEGNPMQLDDGRIEDRDKNAWDMKQAGMKNNKGKGKVPPKQ
jgi:hypothetical protein